MYDEKKLQRPVPSFPADADYHTVRDINLHHAVNIADEYSHESDRKQKHRSLLGVLDLLSDFWRRQYTPTQDIPLKWSLDDNELLFLDEVFITPISHIKKISMQCLDLYSIGLILLDSCLVIVIGDEGTGKHKITRIERQIGGPYEYW